MDDFEGKRIEGFYELDIKASKESIFPLLCPIEEYKWIPGWNCKLIYSESGKNERDCIFTEELSSSSMFDSRVGPATWHTTLFDREKFEFHAVIFNSAATIKWEVKLKDGENGVTKLHWRHITTALNETGIRLIEQGLEEKMIAMASVLLQTLKQYCETAEMKK